jgi:high-affinity K+ transport system ATPase subunit B
MATNKDFSIRIGRSYNITTTVSGIDDWTGKNAVLTAGRGYDADTLVLEKSGTIATSTNKITFELSANETRELSGTYNYEITIYENDGSFVKDTNFGLLKMLNVVDKNPTD